MISIDEATRTIRRAQELGLSCAAFLTAIGPSNVARACNGIGPENMPEKWRKRLNKWLWLFRIPCRGHDCEFTYNNDGSGTRFEAANSQLGHDCLVMADAEYKWFNPLRYVWRHRARAVEWACQTFGWGSWRKAYINAIAAGIVPGANGFPAGAGNAGTNDTESGMVADVSNPA